MTKRQRKISVVEKSVNYILNSLINNPRNKTVIKTEHNLDNISQLITVWPLVGYHTKVDPKINRHLPLFHNYDLLFRGWPISFPLTGGYIYLLILQKMAVFVLFRKYSSSLIHRSLLSFLIYRSAVSSVVFFFFFSVCISLGMFYVIN